MGGIFAEKLTKPETLYFTLGELYFFKSLLDSLGTWEEKKMLWLLNFEWSIPGFSGVREDLWLTGLLRLCQEMTTVQVEVLNSW